MRTVLALYTFHESVVPPLLNGCTIVLNTHVGAIVALVAFAEYGNAAAVAPSTRAIATDMAAANFKIVMRN
jgi:hypothetical protein